MKYALLLIGAILTTPFTLSTDVHAKPPNNLDECAYGSLKDTTATIGNRCNKPVYIEAYNHKEELLITRVLPPMSNISFIWSFGKTLYWFNCEVGTRPINTSRGGDQGCAKSGKKDNVSFTSPLVVNPRIENPATPPKQLFNVDEPANNYSKCIEIQKTSDESGKTLQRWRNTCDTPLNIAFTMFEYNTCNAPFCVMREVTKEKPADWYFSGRIGWGACKAPLFPDPRTFIASKTSDGITKEISTTFKCVTLDELKASAPRVELY